MHFTTPDPLYSRYGSTSPWAHCAANPANAIDPDGRDIYELQRDGRFQFKEKQDREIIMSATGNSIEVPSGFIGSKESGKYQTGPITVDYDYYSCPTDGFDIFQFLVENSDVEWSRAEFDDGKAIIGNSHDYGYDGSLKGFFDKNQSQISAIRIFDHSHPTDVGPSHGDVTYINNLGFSEEVMCRVYYRGDFNRVYYYNINSDGYRFNPDDVQELEEFIVDQKK